MKRIILVAGARPNFMKVAPLRRELARFPGEFEPILVHTGQHYDYRMSEVFFRDLELPPPDLFLGAGSGPPSEQTGRIMAGFEGALERFDPDLVVVTGDVNSTLAAALATAQFRCRRRSGRPRLAHLESGLRSYDRLMPEEMNRVLTDHLADLLFTTTPADGRNLRREGIPAGRVRLVGNILSDTLLSLRSRAAGPPAGLAGLKLRRRAYGLVTLHRPANVDDPKILAGLLETLAALSSDLPLLFPCHPRTRSVIGRAGLERIFRERPGFILTEPLGYLDFLGLLLNSRLVLTDSGGLQAESAILKVPCLTLRDRTEWLVTLRAGGNRLAGTEPEGIRRSFRQCLAGRRRPIRRPALWDGRVAGRVVRALRADLEVNS
ncbi:MAG TPA: UDP-N-acetylglucosamine 2-epimerase (non-hydrolyzing) [bacterium]|uniref:UDP-2,3-diacetamido-2,3-dideoxy-D-glucuronate 2-epimerase n=1 Tax=candidate division TA06 bacterium ADurb.Bin417 TaxID=1852828 RepID=A0A1V5MKI7_UNCT6|nr:MAG: UDP-2,3-diacetamido-2,3-dideoxy-D-glucuronate 2-epimerase [candidate division TA06 bacterium ADurb.Bin417]HNQ34935.1 UDP-N-acetylglucosamine 2-epimerase (non-hydrolyzing) [bacterium]HNS49302.1 UDP-N-acetylglucosamine 2-epimerase (non-hydrolyzing) [bacterium]